MNPQVIQLEPLPNYQLKLWFSNNEERLFDARPYLDKGVFVRLKTESIFNQARVVFGSVEWPGEIDLSYDTLYLDSYPKAFN